MITLYVLINLAYFRVRSFSQGAQSQHVASDAIVMVIGERGATWLTIAMNDDFCLGSPPCWLFDRTLRAVRHGLRRPIFQFCETHSARVQYTKWRSAISGLHDDPARAYRHIRRAVLIDRVRSLDFLPIDRVRADPPTKNTTEAPPPWGCPWTPLVFAPTAVTMTANLWWTRPGRSSIGIALIFLGIPFFRHWRWRFGHS